MLTEKKCKMTMIQRYIDNICEELEGALSYAEYYIIFKNSKPQWSKMYKEMAQAEISHSNYLITMTQEFIDELVWTDEVDLECWKATLNKSAEVENQVKIMLSK